MTFKSWYQERPPIYDIKKSYVDNLEHGPFFDSEFPKRQMPDPDLWIDFLGFPVASPLGVPAGPLLSSNWTKLAAELGFDIVIYKTIRSKPFPAHPLPNMIYVNTQDAPPAIRTELPAHSIEELGVTNSFGMPSMSPAFLMEDIARANEALVPGQVLVVSVVGTPRPNEDFFEDFVKTALFAREAGAKIIEANFSCPNVATKDGILYTNPDTVYQLGTKLVKALGETPLIIKVGLFQSDKQMREVLNAAAKAGIRAVSGINTVSMPVVNESGEPALGEKRKTSGICGGPIRESALKFIRTARNFIDEDKLDLCLMGCGGITTAEHFEQFLDAGANVAQSATGMMWDPLLAMRYHAKKGYAHA